MVEHEVWKPVKQFEGLYEVSNLGNIRSCDRITRDGRFWKGREIGKHDAGSGYVQSILSVDGKYYRVYNHRIVAEAFVPNPDCKPEVNHKDGNKRNNEASNLEWVTKSENHLHRSRILRKPNGGRHRFTDDEVRSIRNDERPRRVIAEEYGVSCHSIYDIKRGKSYRGVAEEAIR